MNNDMSLAGAESVVEYVTVILEDQIFGLPIGRVQDVFMPESLTRVPLAPPEIAGVLNLRGRIVTAMDLRCRLGLPPRAPDVRPMAVGIEWRGESYGLLVDAVGEVMKLADSGREPNPVNLDPKFTEVSMGVHRLESQLLVVLDVERALASPIQAIAA
jgi:purine-binding chemotaxis protein CheW